MMLILLCRVGLRGNLHVALAFLEMGEKITKLQPGPRTYMYSHT